MKELFSVLFTLLEAEANDKNSVFVRSFILSFENPPTFENSVSMGDSTMFGDIKIYMKSFVLFEKKERVHRFLEAIAHEFRHLDQNQCWDELPQVRSSAKSLDNIRAASHEEYWEDEGEADARKFAENFMKAHVDEAFEQRMRVALNEEFGKLEKLPNPVVLFEAKRR